MGLEEGESIRGLLELPQPLPRHLSFSGCALPRERLLVGSHSLPCTLMLVPPSHGQLRACDMGPQLGEGGILFLAIPCRLALFSPLPTLGNKEGGRGEGGPLRTGRIQPKEDALWARGPCTMTLRPGGLSVPAFQAHALPLELLTPRHRLLRQILPSPLAPLEPLTPQVLWSSRVTQPLLAEWVSSALPSRPEPEDGPRVLWRSTSKELTPFPHPSNPHSLCEIYLRVVPSEGWGSRRPGGPRG